MLGFGVFTEMGIHQMVNLNSVGSTLLLHAQCEGVLVVHFAFDYIFQQVASPYDCLLMQLCRLRTLEIEIAHLCRSPAFVRDCYGDHFTLL